jgi:hypothetical protein
LVDEPEKTGENDGIVTMGIDDENAGDHLDKNAEQAEMGKYVWWEKREEGNYRYKFKKIIINRGFIFANRNTQIESNK